jgi:hydrogenase nickel incorporation protein HypA/HybF
MHELSIAGAILAIAEETANGRRVLQVDVKVGRLRQVVPSALAFAWELVAQGTVAEGAELALVDVEAAGLCASCGAETVLSEFPFVCGACGSASVEVTRGEELLVEALELGEEEIDTETLVGAAEGRQGV